MKKFLKTFALFLAFCQLSLCFASCASKETEGESESECVTEAETAFEFNKATLASYVIVIPSDSDEDMTSVAKMLGRMIESEIGVSLEIRPDTYGETELEILVGPTNREETQESYKGLKHFDSGYALVGKKLLIIGYVRDAVEEAILLFHANVLYKKADGVVLMTEDDKTIFKGDADKTKIYEWISESSENYYASVLEGLTVNAIGDSYFNYSKLDTKWVWISLMAEKYGMNMNNYGKGGSTVTNGIEPSNPMCERYVNMANNNADIILVEGGANDLAKNVEIGEIDSYDVATFTGALNVMIEGIKEKYPNSMVVCITSWNLPEGYKDSKISYIEYSDAMEAVAERQGVYFIKACDPEVSGIDMQNSYFRSRYSMSANDANHLNFDGMKIAMSHFEKILAEYYEDFLSKNNK